jgi:hypothetical protein
MGIKLIVGTSHLQGKKPLALKVDVEKGKELVGTNTHASWRWLGINPLVGISMRSRTNK